MIRYGTRKTLDPFANASLLDKFFVKIREKGILFALTVAYSYIKCRLGIESPIQKYRADIGHRLDEIFHSTVAYGPFKGLKLSSNSWWGRYDRGSMLLGIYEKEVLHSLTIKPDSYKTFIDLGAADGYYGLGVLVNNLFEKSYCFERSENGRCVIKSNALINKVHDRVAVHGVADQSFYKVIRDDEIERCVLFIDIEGGEFDLMDDSIFRVFRNSIIFIELHDFNYEDGDAKLRILKDRAKNLFVITELKTTSRDMSVFPELENFCDTDRWLICSEGRGKLTTWLRLDPIEVVPKNVS